VGQEREARRKIKTGQIRRKFNQKTRRRHAPKKKICGGKERDPSKRDKESKKKRGVVTNERNSGRIGKKTCCQTGKKKVGKKSGRGIYKNWDGGEVS